MKWLVGFMSLIFFVGVGYSQKGGGDWLNFVPEEALGVMELKMGLIPFLKKDVRIRTELNKITREYRINMRDIKNIHGYILGSSLMSPEVVFIMGGFFNKSKIYKYLLGKKGYEKKSYRGYEYVKRSNHGVMIIGKRWAIISHKNVDNIKKAIGAWKSGGKEVRGNSVIWENVKRIGRKGLRKGLMGLVLDLSGDQRLKRELFKDASLSSLMGVRSLSINYDRSMSKGHTFILDFGFRDFGEARKGEFGVKSFLKYIGLMLSLLGSQGGSMGYQEAFKKSRYKASGSNLEVEIMFNDNQLNSITKKFNINLN